jgi:hypothetical protein
MGAGKAGIHLLKECTAVIRARGLAGFRRVVFLGGSLCGPVGGG